jgi:hypothetical protein
MSTSSNCVSSRRASLDGNASNALTIDRFGRVFKGKSDGASTGELAAFADSQGPFADSGARQVCGAL